MSEKKYDLVVIGAGPGGYVASIVAAQKGMKVANIEKRETLGGTCLNVGCIPSKALLHASEQYENNVKNNANLSWGIKTSDVSIDVQQLMKKKSSIIDELTKGINFLFSKNKIDKYKLLIKEEKQRLKIEAYEKEQKIKKQEKQKELENVDLQLKLKQKQLKEEILLEKQRSKDLKSFLRKEQAILRQEQSERQRKFLEEIKLQKQIEKFRVREIKELEKLEKISLKEQREDYAGLQDRIDKLKEKYRLIRDQKIRERVEALGIKTSDKDDRDALLKKEHDYIVSRQKIENSLESFYRSASSLVFQLNKRHLTREMSIFRCIDRRFETGEIFIKKDDSKDEEWLILIYIKDNSLSGDIVIEDKSNPEKNHSHEFKSTDIFTASDLMVDSLTQLISRERSKTN